jgi:uncharacterized protein involved in exopolysaccharide biosynthesis
MPPLELSDYLRAIGRRFWILVIVPVVAAGLAAAYLFQQPQMYEAKATVILPIPADRSASVVTQTINDFTTELKSDFILTRLASGTGERKSALSSGLSVNQNGSSRVLGVTYSSTKAVRVKETVRRAAALTLENLFAPQVATQQNVVQEAQSQYDKARSATDKFKADHGLVLPEDDYRQQAGNLSQLELQLQQNVSTNGTTDSFGRRIDNSKAIASYKAEIDTQQKQLADLGSLVLQYRPLQDSLSQATTNLGTAQRDQQQVQASLTAARAPSTVRVTPATSVSKASSIAKVVVVVLAVAIVLSIGLLVVLELLRPSSQRAVGLLGEAPAPPARAPVAPPSPTHRAPVPVPVTAPAGGPQGGARPGTSRKRGKGKHRQGQTVPQGAAQASAPAGAGAVAHPGTAAAPPPAPPYQPAPPPAAPPSPPPAPQTYPAPVPAPVGFTEHQGGSGPTDQGDHQQGAPVGTKLVVVEHTRR